MSMSAILIAALVMSVLGLIFGALLGVTGRVFKVPVNRKGRGAARVSAGGKLRRLRLPRL